MLVNSELGQSWMRAATAGDVSALQSLLNANPLLLNAQVHHQSTALHLATWKGHREAVEFLVNQGADIETQDQTGMTALQIDVMRICLQKMRPTVFLRSQHIDVKSPVALAISKRKQIRDRSSYRDIDTSVLDLLLEHNAKSDEALLNAVEYGLTKHVEKILAHGADAHAQDTNGRSAMDIAGEHGFVDVVNVLAEQCPELIATAGDKTLVMAVRHEFPEILETLYDRVQSTLGFIDGEELGGRLLNIAAEYDALSCARFLLRRGVSLDWMNAKGERTMQVACASGRPKILELLLHQTSSAEPTRVDLSRLQRDTVVLNHRCIKMDVLEYCNTNNYFSPSFVAMKMPENLEIMEVLIRDDAKFAFPTRQSRDSIAPLLSSWLLQVAPREVTKLLVDIESSSCIRHKLRHVILALAWQEHTYEALLLTFLVLFSPQASDVQQALNILKLWMLRFEANLVALKLVTDALTL
ncbi:hypothetical protein PHYBOEH_011739 [Phytophthora boehmeriae]|uniref:Uncharacterized protein n=1 Tax=Phytophthora boehmeriae TaxID=109152 RepID=A0A8T1WWY0_9STRA|nr:hypothetical protein PHYBOEH_011739 [Phytophthora boehmeriae]